jgi:tripartite-type tricarboxylate transporter receptor subunit TctC
MKDPIRILVLCAAAMMVPVSWAQSPAYPLKTITFIVPFTPGGAGDILMRLVAQKMSENLGQAVVVDNRPGAGGSIGAQWVAAADPDGYTLLMGTSSTHGINPHLYSKLGYDVMRDFEPVTVLATSDLALAVNVNSPYRSVEELVAASGKSPLQYGTLGNGTTSHLAAALFGISTKAKFEHIPYKGGSPAMNDLLGSRIDFMFDNASAILPQRQGGKVRVLATTGRTRSAMMNDVPTMIESGVPNYEMIGWWGVFAPARTPKPVIDRIHAEIATAMASPVIVERLRQVGNEAGLPGSPAPSPAQTRAFVQSQLEMFRRLVDTVGLKVD